jgi:hypothetical protein
MRGSNVVRFIAVAVVIATLMFSSTFVGMGGRPKNEARGTPQTILARVGPATDGTLADTGFNQPNAICYAWEQAEAFIPTVSVATFGTNTKGIAIDSPGTWMHNVAYTGFSGDGGSIWDAWTVGEHAVMIFEVFNDQSVSGRNYTMIYEATVVAANTNFGANSAQNAITVINDPILVGAWSSNNTAMISIAPQTTGFEVATLFDGYRVFKSPNPITQTNQGTALGDATLEGGNWVYRDTACTSTAYYAVRVKWDGGTYPFYAPLYSYGMSNDTQALFITPGPQGLWVERSNPNVILHWASASNPTTQWNVYYSTNKFAAFPSGWTLATATSAARSWTHAGAYGDGNTWYYLVKANNSGTLSGNSTMGVKQHKAFTHNNLPKTNIMFFTMPQNSGYAKASDIVMELEGALTGPGLNTKINVVGKWVPGDQASTAFLYVVNYQEWTGDDFTIGPGDGFYLSVTSNFTWVVCGMDVGSMLSFTKNVGKTNIMYFNLPTTSRYATASQIVLDLEGALTGPGLQTKINGIGKWLPADQASTAFIYDLDFEEWTGDDFAITPGSGFYFSITSSFTWTPALITPVVP